jgi:hypothetical protein
MVIATSLLRRRRASGFGATAAGDHHPGVRWV